MERSALHAVGRALLEVERRIQSEEIHQRVDHQALAAGREHADGAVDLLERQRLVGAGDHDGLVLLGLLLSEGEYRSKHEEKKEKSRMQT